jgi:predicted ATPase
MKSWRFLQFNPDDLRKPSDKRTGDDIISSTGKDMAAALFRIKQSDSYNLIDIYFITLLIKLDNKAFKKCDIFPVL